MPDSNYRDLYMKHYIHHCWQLSFIILICIGSVAISATSLDKEQFYNDRKVILERIHTINHILKQTSAKKELNIGQLNAVNTKIESNKLLIGSITKELNVVNAQMAAKEHKIHTLEEEFSQLKREYTKILFWNTQRASALET